MKNTDKAAVEARKAVRSQRFNPAARLGLVANGALHGMLGLLALNVALARGGKADQSGAMKALPAQPGGDVLNWTCFLDRVLLTVWSIAQLIVPNGKGSASSSSRQAPASSSLPSAPPSAATHSVRGRTPRNRARPLRRP